jgi:hypothetical protein
MPVGRLHHAALDEVLDHRHRPGGARTAAAAHWLARPRDHAAETNGHYTTTPSNGRLAWSDGNGPPEINHAHHPDELLNDPDDDP